MPWGAMGPCSGSALSLKVGFPNPFVDMRSTMQFARKPPVAPTVEAGPIVPSIDTQVADVIGMLRSLPDF